MITRSCKKCPLLTMSWSSLYASLRWSHTHHNFHCCCCSRHLCNSCIQSKKNLSESTDTRYMVHRVQVQPWSFNGPYRAPKRDQRIFKILEPLSGCVYHFNIIDPLASLTMLEHIFGHCGTLPRVRGPSSTFMDPTMDPKMEAARLISGDPS